MTRSACLAIAVLLGACAPGAESRGALDPNSPAAWLAEGQARYEREVFDSATLALDAAIEGARRGGDRMVEGRALTWRGLAAWKSGRFASARADGEAALSIKRAIGDREELFRSWNGLALLAWHEGRHFDALALCDSATAAAMVVGNQADVGKAAGNRALVSVELGSFSSAREGFEQMLASTRVSGNRLLEGNALTNLAMLAVRTGAPETAVPLIAEARLRYQEVGYEGGEQVALAQLAEAYHAMGQIQAAFAAGDTAVQIARRLDQPHDVAGNLEVLAQLHRDVGDDRRAMALYEEAQAINTTLGATVEQGSDIRLQAEILRDLGQGASALSAATRALRLHREAGAAFEELSDVLLLAEITSDAGDTASARKYIDSGRELATHLDVRPARSAVTLVEARNAARTGQPRRVQQILTAAWPDLTSGDFDTEWQAWDLRAGAELELGSLREAAASSRRAVAAIERVRSTIGSPSQRTGFLARRAQVYERLVEILMRLGLVDEGFGVADEMRGRALADRVSGPDTLALRVQELEARMRELQRDGNPSWKEAMGRIEAELVRARRITPQDGPSAHQLASTLRMHLGGNEALLLYVVSEKRLHLFVLRRDRLRHFAHDVASEAIAARVRLARDLVASKDPGVDRVLEELHRLLVAPAGQAGLLRGVERLVVVPHGALMYLPFGALRDSTSARYQVQDYSLATLPSASALLTLLQRPMPGNDLASGTVLAPTPERLPASRAEAEAFQRAIAGSRALIGPQATEAATRNALRSSALVHIAGHATMNPVNPLFSRIELAPGSAAGTDDGVLEVRELVGLNIQSRLVYLSACETAMGGKWATSYQAGEDYATLGQALLLAGANSAVATLWRIDDAAASALAEGFYRHLRSASPVDAIALAQRDLLAQPEYSKPYFWAGHVLVGAP